MTIPDRVLRQYLAGALDPPDQEDVERAMAASPSLLARLAVLRADTAPEPPDGGAPRPWFVPPPGLVPPGTRLAPLTGRAAPVAVMDGGGGGGWLVLHLDVPPERHHHRVVVLERHGADWAVGFPASEDELLEAGSLGREGDRVRLDYALDAPGVGRIAVVLVPPEIPIDWSADADQRWAAVRDGLAAGTLAAVSFSV
jgi:hypothetical protein